ncbi:MAG: hypothetical protein IT431_00220 [Phycisphaerales bacterium]|nr:hypothetical protein [Phycisphaerales bacterium]
MRLRPLHAAAALLLGLIAPSRTLLAQASGLLLADDTKQPRVQVTWHRADGTTSTLEAALPYASQDELRALGDNLQAFVALGGSRLEKGAGHPAGAIVRVGLVKADPDLMMFEDIAHATEVLVELRGIYFNQPALPDPDSLIQRLRYKADDVIACGLTIDQAEMFNLASHDDDMGGTILPQQARFGCLTGGEEHAGEASITVAADGEFSLRAVIPYRLLRHKGDPWSLELPGSFFEPFQFDLEFEVLPEAVAAAEGILAPDAPR